MENNQYSKYDKMSLMQSQVALYGACTQGRLDEVKYLLSSPTMHSKPFPSLSMIKDACKLGHHEVFDYFMEYSDLTQDPQWRDFKKNALTGCVLSENLAGLRYFLELSEFKEGKFWDESIDHIFYVALENEKYQSLNFLITEKKIHLTQAMNVYFQYFDSERKDRVMNMFEMAQLNDHLHDNLEALAQNSIKPAKKKI